MEELGYHKFCGDGFQNSCQKTTKKQRMAASLTFLEAYEKDGDSLLDRVITGDETRVKHVTCETKKQSMEWGHISSPKRPRKCLETLSARKIMATVFWGQGVCASGGFPVTWFNNKL